MSTNFLHYKRQTNITIQELALFLTI